MKILHISEDFDFSKEFKERLEPFNIDLITYVVAEDAMAQYEESPNKFSAIIIDHQVNMNPAVIIDELKSINPAAIIVAQGGNETYFRKMIREGVMGTTTRSLSDEDLMDLDLMVRELIRRAGR